MQRPRFCRGQGGLFVFNSFLGRGQNKCTSLPTLGSSEIIWGHHSVLTGAIGLSAHIGHFITGGLAWALFRTHGCQVGNRRKWWLSWGCWGTHHLPWGT